MTTLKYIDDDVVRVYKFGEPRNKDSFITCLFWGDNVRVVGKVDNQWKLDFTVRTWDDDKKRYEWKQFDAAIPAKTRFREKPLLKIRFVDVCQGDAAIIETPKGKIVLLDGGEQNYLRNYVSSAWAHVLRFGPLDVDAVVVTHGDSDHFEGLIRLVRALQGGGKHIVKLNRVYHNGLVKASTSVGVANIFGKSVMNGGRYAVELVDDLRTVDDSRCNLLFKKWKETLRSATQRNPALEVKRISYGDHNVFDFLKAEGISVHVLGPIVEQLNGVLALPYLHSDSGGYSASHTVNGHSVVFKLGYGNVRFLFSADLNEESEAGLLRQVRSDNVSLASEVFKVPHHGSMHFSPRMLEAVRPTVSVISSGDESQSKEYIHPRAGLVGALGKYSHQTVEKPLIYVTEMVAFFKRVGKANIRTLSDTDKESEKPIRTMNAYIKEVAGIVHVRTDGERVLVVTHGGKPDQKESYAFHVDQQGKITFEEKTRVI